MKHRLALSLGAALLFLLGAISKDVINPARAASQVVMLEEIKEVMAVCDFSKSIVFIVTHVLCVKR